MERVLVVSASQKSIDTISKLLLQSGMPTFDVVTDSASVRRKVIDNPYDLVIINSPLKDEFGIELALYLTEKVNCGVLLIVKAEQADEVAYKVEECGVFVIAKPFNQQIFHQAIRFIASSQKRFQMLHKEKEKLVQKVDDIRMIDRAKCCLIEYLKLTEAAAHRHIEKQAMDMRLTKREVAESILKKYGNW